MRVEFFLPLTLAAALMAGAAVADDVWISDLLANPSRYWNTTVSVTGRVSEAVPEPQGTTRGTYTLVDESGPDPIAVRTNELPPLGQSFAVVGVVIQDPAQADRPLIKELKRTRPGTSGTLRALLIGGGILFVVLLAIFLVLLMRPPERAALPSRAGSPSLDTTAASEEPPSGFETAKLPSTGPEPGGDETQVFMSLGAQLVVTRGPDKGKEFPLHKQLTTIGRAGSRKNDIELTDATVSKEQASVFFDGVSREFSIGNQSRTNPTMVEGSVVTEPVVLSEDTVIEIGMTTLEFRST